MNLKVIITGVLAIACFTFAEAQSSELNSKLIVYRNGNLYGSLTEYPVKIDGKEMDRLSNKDNYQMEVIPGKHTISPRNGSKEITVDFKKGMTYVVKYKTQFGLLGARAKPMEVTMTEAQEDSKYFKELVMNEGDDVMKKEEMGKEKLKKDKKKTM